MNAVDTNVLARFFVTDRDDAEAIKQQPAAVRAMSEKVFVSVSVVLEFEWVLRGFYQISRAEIARIFDALCGLDNVHLENRGTILSAMNAYQSGLDFADALHLASSSACVNFVSFDQRFMKKSNSLRFIPRVIEPS